MVPLTDKYLNPQHKAEVDALLALLDFVKELKLGPLRGRKLTKLVIMCNNVYVIQAMTHNVRRWRESTMMYGVMERD